MYVFTLPTIGDCSENTGKDSGYGKDDIWRRVSLRISLSRGRCFTHAFPYYVRVKLRDAVYSRLPTSHLLASPTSPDVRAGDRYAIALGPTSDELLSCCVAIYIV